MPTKSEGAIGSLDYTGPERKTLARKSHRWRCEKCGLIKDHLKTEKVSLSSIADADDKDILEQRKQQQKFLREEAEFKDFMSKVKFQVCLSVF